MSGSHNYHAKISASDSSRWMLCSASISYEEMFDLATSKKPLSKDQTARLNDLLLRFGVSFDEARTSGYNRYETSAAAEEGTQAHDYAQALLLGTMTEHELPAAFHPVLGYVHRCQALARELGGEPFIEMEVPLYYDRSETGTADFVLATEGRVVIRDLKYGQGVKVEAEYNSQLAIYAMSVLADLEEEGLYTFYPDTIIDIGIDMPRYRGSDNDPLAVWQVNYADFKAFTDRIQEAHDLAADEDGIGHQFAPGTKACRWCKLKGFCGAIRNAALVDMPSIDDMPDLSGKGAKAKFTKERKTPEAQLEGLNVGMLSRERMVNIIRALPAFSLMISAIETTLETMARNGDPAPGTKLVMGREGNRKWEDEEAAEKLLVNQGFTKEERCSIQVISVAKAEELLADKLQKKSPDFSPRLLRAFDALITRSPGQPTLALEEDPRPAIAGAIGDMPSDEDSDDI